MVCYIQKYVIILAGIFPLTSPPTKLLGGCVPGIPGGVDASGVEWGVKLYSNQQVGVVLVTVIVG